MGDPVTYLFVPGDRPERFGKALASAADRVILDLEDAVRPEAKAAARQAIREADLDWSRVVIRINAGAEGAEDHGVLRTVAAAGVLVPKAEDADALIAVREAAAREIEVIPQIETVRGLEGVGALLAAPGVRRAAFGHLDFSLDLGVAPDWDALAWVRSRLVYASRLAGASAPVDSVTPDLSDTDALAREAFDSRRFGFGGKLLIHPKQIAPVLAAFAPSDDEIAWAKRVVKAVEAGASGAVAVDGKMIDRPVEDAARRILGRAGG